ncbi:ferritin-like domain-containing protein [Aquisalibacillus elongatus]|uniref:Uncharacterized protein DUF2202 n=1 Tax=Aquisalibacillus elongatus TaxID=485577 RepID=A0A3N5C264_9BACI|nr:DUF2202 domain-containing protein [Aquisalibacillus elongatus]RPF53452.1 uncharacterized protein DUF2202 [Aquisalibacillus elongatus]
MYLRQGVESYGAKGALSASALDLSQMLTYAIQDEYLAQSRYQVVINEFGAVRPFTQIQQAEVRHINALIPLFNQYQIPIPEDDSRQYVMTPITLKQAFDEGVEGEIDNISMYNRFLNLDIPNDVRFVFTQLRDASLNHLEAFRRGALRV